MTFVLIPSPQKAKSTASSRSSLRGNDEFLPEKSTVVHDDLFSFLNLTLVLFDFSFSLYLI